MKTVYLLIFFVFAYSFTNGQAKSNDKTLLTCNNWLKVLTPSSYVNIGDLDIPGNQLTVEALFSKDVFTNSAGYPAVDVVSKHTMPSDVNYLLRTDFAEINVGGTYYNTPAVSCLADTHHIYHVAMVYDGTQLRFYRNGFLMSSVNCSGNMVQNNITAKIGASISPPSQNTLIGYINEVRIWNVARTQAQLQSYMTTSLASPTIQPGLKGYYIFNDLLNKQGNALFNGAIVGSAAINQTNPQCNFVADSCPVPQLTCNNWLKVPAPLSGVTVGNLNVTGNQVTIEAMCNATGDITRALVSKHQSPVDVNYFLCNDLAQITTDQGFYSVYVPDCGFVKNKTYHVALVYNGSSLKLYRNGFLIGQTAASGNLITNSYPTTIGEQAYAMLTNNAGITNVFKGLIDEVRIWNVERTQAQIRTYMNSSLPSPATQTGLLGYYIFDDLTNKQGNIAFNGTLKGTATINQTNPNCNFVADSCPVPQLTCNNWLNVPGPVSGVTVGNLDVTGNKITIEAMCNATGDITRSLVSKHRSPSDVNYFLCNDLAQITTNIGFFSVYVPLCGFTNNKTYHVALVYNGSTLKLYRNGFLVGQTAATGNLITNSYPTSIGEQAYAILTNNPGITAVFKGLINEVRIWNVERTQAQLRTYMNSSLPSPATQTGLLGYYIFDDLTNKQGNAAFNGTLKGTAAINQTNPNCLFLADSCGLVAGSISNIVNSYTPVTSLNPCDNKITVEDASTFNVGDTVLMIQMKGALVDSTNTAAFGTVLNNKNAGNYEFNYVKSKAGNVIELKDTLTRKYDIPDGKVQLIRVPYYISASVTSTLTCLPWDGSKGGVLAFNVRDTLSLFSNIDVTGKGFSGGKVVNTNLSSTNCSQNNYFYPVPSLLAAPKGESITTLLVNKRGGKGSLASAGGGGLDHNSGGGGGGNAAVGGFGGYQLYSCTGSFFDNRGIGGKALPYSNALNRIYLGGGGGAGHCNNGPTTPPGLDNMDGGNGGGLVIISSNHIMGNSNSIISKGDSAYEYNASTGEYHDGMGGGGAGGTVLLSANNYINNLTVNVYGGRGGDMHASIAGGIIGPGGGGAGGVAWFKQASLPANITVINTGGRNGYLLQDANNAYGSTPGSPGINLFSLVVPLDTILFKPNIDSVRIKDSLIGCKVYDFRGLGYTNRYPIASWQWNFGDAATAGTQNTTHTYAGPGTYNVKLVVTDVNGCKDSIIKPVTVLNCTSISNIINTYTPVLALNRCDNKVTVENASTFNVGDTVLIIQMKGAAMDSTNTAAFGTITDYKNAGNYEFNYVKSKSGNVIELMDTLTRSYDIPFGKVQLIRVPYYNSVAVNATLTCLPWDGNKGGVLVFNVKDTLDMFADINTTGKGFLKGITKNTNFNGFTCGITDYYYANNTLHAAGKGEGIASLSTARNSGKGPAANGGGGGMDTNSGGGGGSNGNKGGRGGYELNGCPNHLTSQNWGFPGNTLSYNTTTNKIFMGGGGGAGHCNNQYDGPAQNADFNGGNGGGLIIINSNYIKNNSQKIISKGDSAYELNLPSSFVSHDGMGGGGAGGTVLLNNNNFINTLQIDVSGGRGANMVSMPAGGLIGPGGGGGGGVVWIKQNSLPAALSITNAGGIGGVIIQNGNDPYGATAGLPGINVFSLAVPVDTVLFKPNIDSVRIKDSLTACRAYDFKGFGYIKSYPIASWQWSFGDAATASTQNTSHTYAGPGTYNVKLVVTDVNGCKDSIIKPLTVINCNFVITNIINEYTEVNSFDPCTNTLTVSDASRYNVGDTVLLIQMKGASIITGNGPTYGNITAYNNAGNYEFNYILQKTGNNIVLKNTLIKQYNIPAGKVQLVRVPYFTNATVTGTLTCLPWTGSKGGVLVFNVRDTVDMISDIDVSETGFNGGAVGSGFTCNSIGWAAGAGAGQKGEGIADYIINQQLGGAHLANGGGGSFAGNSGAGGGGNYGAGGIGGKDYSGCFPSSQSVGGAAMDYTLGGRIFMGGGGGGGQQDNGLPVFAGGKGGGIVIIQAGTVKSTNNNKIKTNGGNNSTIIRDEGGAAGGAGGSVLLLSNNYIGNLTIEAKGGEGNSNNNVTFPTACHGPGAGGAGGLAAFSTGSVPAGVTFIGTGGNAGKILNPAAPCFNTTYGAANGGNGGNLFNLTYPLSAVLFIKNIDSVRMKDSALSCTAFDFKGFAFTKLSPIVSWRWDFGDATAAFTQNAIHNYGAATGPFTVKLTATDADGCKDSILKTINPSSVNLDFSFTINACSPLAVQFNAAGTAVSNPHWEMGPFLINGNLNPQVTFPAYGNYVIKYSASNGVCTDTVTKTISLAIIPADIILTPDTTICTGTGKRLRAAPSVNFCWTPSTYLDNPLLLNPTTTPVQPITYFHTSEIAGANLISNGDFSAGNTGFTSDYSFVASNSTANAAYGVVANAAAWNTGAANCGDHSGTGNMYVANGATAAGVKAWKTSVPVTPNTNYQFSAWVQSISAANFAVIKFYINDVQMSAPLNAPPVTCQWVQQRFNWNSGNNTSATLALEDSIYIANGNDFALDDISFAPVNINRDSVKIAIDTPRVKTINDTLICGSGTLLLTTTGSATYSWSPVTGLSDPNIASPLASINNAVQYIVTGTSLFGCVAKDTVNLAVQTATSIQTDSSICAGQNYTLPWGTVVNSTGIYSDTLHYFATGCDSVRRIINLTVQNFTAITANASLCAGQNYTLPWGTVVTTAGTYRDTLHYTTGCDSIRRTVILVLQNFTSTTANPSICAGQNYTLPWGTIVNTAGTYQDTLHYVSGCDSVRRTVNLTVQAVATNASSISICAGQNYTLPWGTVVNTNGLYADTLHYLSGCDSIRRSVNLTVQNFTATTANASLCAGQNYTLPWGTVVTAAGTYRDTLHYTTGCDSIRRTVILALQNFTSTTANPSICAGQNYTLPWGTIVNTAGTYQDTLHYISGCDSVRRTVNLTVQAVATNASSISICAGQNYTLPWGTVVNTSGVYADTLHYISGCDSIRRSVNLTVQAALVSTTQAAICANEQYTLPWGPTVNSAGLYRDTLRTAIGCDSLIRNVNLAVNPLPLVGASKSNDINCSTGSALLFATGAANYTWSPLTGLSNPAVPNPLASPAVTTQYIVTGTDINGCTNTAAVTVQVNFTGKVNYYMPNSFTPNGDGLNDCYRIKYFGQVQDLQFTIYNRWGEKVFYTTDPNNCWNGTYKGLKAEQGNYVYFVKAKTACGEVIKKGNLVLIR